MNDQLKLKRWEHAVKPFGRSLCGALGAALLATIVAMTFAGPAIAQSALPYRDSNANGYIGFCDKSKHQVTSGSLYDQPFAWTAVSSTPAPAGYEHGKAVLIAYQPRKEVDPGEWSGRQLTAASTFTNPRHPMSQATNGDDPLLFFTQAFPPRWDGLVELRMYFGAPKTTMHQAPYPATNIRVSGDRWAVVSGGSVDCAAGKATSDETRALPSSALASPAPMKVAGVASSKSASPQPTANSGITNVASGPSNSGGVGSGVVTVGLITVALLGGVAGGIHIWRRRRSAVDA